MKGVEGTRHGSEMRGWEIIYINTSSYYSDLVAQTFSQLLPHKVPTLPDMDILDDIWLGNLGSKDLQLNPRNQEGPRLRRKFLISYLGSS